MVYRGHVKGGVVVFEAQSPPDGAEVRVEVVEKSGSADIWNKLRKYSGSIKGLPRDMAQNHDFYIHGAPKK